MTAKIKTTDEQVEQVSEDTAALELEKLQRKLAREERKARREIEAAKQKKAMWVLPVLLAITTSLAWILSKFQLS